MKKYILFIFILGFVFSIKAQEYVNIKKATSCENAIEISTTKKFGPTTPPAQLPSDPNNIFARNQHPVWYTFKTEKDGVLLFDIIPLDTLDNYDFVIYKAESKDFCKDYKENKIVPVRSNFYRTDISKQGRTGLSINGDTRAYETGIEVKKGEKYFLLLNNTFENGQGHVITFKYLETYLITGKVVDAESGNPIQATIMWENTRNKDEAFKTTCDKKGEYNLKVSVSVEAHTFPRYLITAYTDKYFLSDTVIPTRQIPNIEKHPIQFKIKKIRQGYNYDQLGNIYFEPNEYIAIPEADKILKKLVRMMMLNPLLTVTLEGHTNGFYPSTEVDLQLSENRAKIVKNYLIENGIDHNRINIQPFGCTKLIYPAAKDEYEESFNRRVEINITKF